MLLAYLEHKCVVGEPAALEDTAAIIGRAVAGSGLTLRAFATIRADGQNIRIGDNVYFGERATSHIVDSRIGTTIGDCVTVGRYGLVHACTLGNRVVVGEGAAVMDGASVENDAVIAADSIVSPGKKLPGGWLYQGLPAKPVRVISNAERDALANSIRLGNVHPLVRSGALPPISTETPAARQQNDASWNRSLRDSPNPSTAYIAPTAVVIGNVQLGNDAGIYFGCVVDANDGRIVIGARTNVQDNSFLVTDKSRGDLVVGTGVTIGHNVQIGSGRFGDNCLVGMMARVEDNVIVEPAGCIAGGAWVEAGTVVKAGWIWAGRPARPFRELRSTESAEFAHGRDIYIEYGAAYRRMT